MKILLLGEFSGLYTNLKAGLLELGHDTVIASGGDIWKNIPRDIDLKSYKYFTNIMKLTNYDVVQLINPFIFVKKRAFICVYLKMLAKYIINHNKKLFLTAGGDDAYFWQIARYKLKNMPFDDFLKYDLKKQKYFMESKKAFKFNKFIADMADGIIPNAYEYYISYLGHKNLKLKKFIPMPINLSKIKYTDNKIKNNKLVVFHGLNRPGFKGTIYIQKAFEILRKKYPNDLELIIDGNLPLNKYLELIQRTNVIVDQTFGYSVGMNALYSMAQGKIVLAGGYKKEALEMLGASSSPSINIMPDENSIVLAIQNLLENKDKIQSIGYESRIFVQKYHNYIDIAKKYLDIWNVKILLIFTGGQTIMSCVENIGGGSKPLVSVMVVTYNQENFIRECLDSILIQDYENIEIVVADDCSTDGTREILKEYKNKYPNKFVLKFADKNQGITKNSNLALFACSGKYICTLGGDDVFLLGKISKQVEFMEKNPKCAISYHNVEVFDSDTNKTMFYYNDRQKIIKNGTIRELIKHGPSNCALSNMVRKDSIPKFGFAEILPVASDWMFYIDVLANGGTIDYIDEVLGRYRRHANNITKKVDYISQGELDHLISCQIIIAKYPQYLNEVFNKYAMNLKNLREKRDVNYLNALFVSLKLKLHPKVLIWIFVYFVTFGKIKL